MLGFCCRRLGGHVGFHLVLIIGQDGYFVRALSINLKRLVLLMKEKRDGVFVTSGKSTKCSSLAGVM